MKNRGTIIAVTAVALVLLVSAGIAVAAGTAGGGDGVCASGERRVAGDGLSYSCRNAGESERICAENRAGEGTGACEGDCDQERLRERDCDGECDGDGTQSRSGWNDETVEAGLAGPQAGETRGGECAGDCERTQDRLCDGSCDGECDGDGTQSQARGGR